MKRAALDHTKMRRLARALQVPKWGAVGILETLWQLTARETPAGNLGKLSNEDIAAWLEWQGEADELVRGLTACGWLDASESCRLYVHDWHEHCDDTTDNALARSGQRYANGSLPRMTRIAKSEREEILARLSASEACKPFHSDSDNLHILKDEESQSHEKPQEATKSHRKPQKATALPCLALPCQSLALPEPLEPPYPPSRGVSGASREPPGGELEVGQGGDDLGAEHGPVLPGSDPRPGQEGFEMALGIAARWVTRRAGITQKRMESTVGVALKAEMRRGGGTLVEVAKLADSRLGEYARDGPLLRIRYGPEKFIALGHWLHPEGWEYDRVALDQHRMRQSARYR